MLLRAESIEKRFDAVPVLCGVNLSLDRGQTLALTGESGSGKSTLLHILGALEPADAGQVRIDGQDIGALNEVRRAALRRQKIGFVFQQFNLIPSLTVDDNLAFQARLAKRADARWLKLLARCLGMTEHMGKYPEQLSGGQQQRVAIGRALAGRPPLVLADEPTGNLDEATGASALEVMLQLVRDTGTALLMATHSERVAGRLDRRLHLRHGRVT